MQFFTILLSLVFGLLLLCSVYGMQESFAQTPQLVSNESTENRSNDQTTLVGSFENFISHSTNIVTWVLKSPENKLVAIGQEIPDSNGDFSIIRSLDHPNPEEESEIISLTTDRTDYSTGDSIIISSKVSTHNFHTPIAFQILKNGLLVNISQDTVSSDETFSHNIIATGELWKDDGTYAIKAHYGNDIKETSFVLKIIDDIIEPNKIIICHIPPVNTDNPQTITISENSLQSHLDHGDIIGECIVIPPQNIPPVLESIKEFHVKENISLEFIANATDSDIPKQDLVFSLSGEPSGSLIDSITGKFTWITSIGIFVFDIIVSDGIASDTEQIRIIVEKDDSTNKNEQSLIPYGVTTDSNDRIIVTEPHSDRILIFDSAGNFVTKFGSKGLGDGQFNHPDDVTTDSNDRIIVADILSFNIQIFDSEGNFVTKFGINSYDVDMHASIPFRVTTDSNDRIIVTGGFNHNIQIFDSAGNFVTKFGSKGSGDGQFNHPSGVTTDSNDRIIVTDTANHRIQIFDSEGNFVTKFGSKGLGDGQLGYANDIVADINNRILVVDRQNYRIQIFDSDGNFVTKFGSRGSDSGQFFHARSITIDSHDRIIVTDPNNYRIQIFDSDGNFITKLSTAPIHNVLR